MLITVGYARAAKTGILAELGPLLWTYSGILSATVGSALLLAAGVTSYRRARSRMKYETWWAIHLYTYPHTWASASRSSTRSTPVPRSWGIPWPRLGGPRCGWVL
ncbi:hypothetical protein [Streptomyces avermitilis]|uniref:hypothetical protein n=1 Tax=Streptomyces avermitilis TaxID=33903 RepID=UPI0037F13462